MRAHRRLALVSLFLFGSGFCALVYQLAWLRALRLIFGASTASSAAVLAVFMGGLGLGSLLLGRRGDRVKSPLAFYGALEIGVGALAAASPLLVALAEAIYTGAGGSARLGGGGATVLRLALSAVILGLPTFLMGGTLPAAVRAATAAADSARRSLGALYAFNTLGALAGATATTFVFVEALGLRRTLWLAAALNLLVGMVARAVGRRDAWRAPVESPLPAGEQVAAAPAVAPGLRRFVFAAAAAVGFVFFLMELVWYRMLAPILGGSTYTFGIILIVALAGIGLGGLLYGAGRETRRPGLGLFALTCGLEALFLALPLALGWRLAFVALVVRELQAMGFAALATGWTVVAALVVFPAAVVAGFQFPLLVAVLGEGRRRVARDVGLTYAWNTAGAIAGSLAGGFGLLPLLTAPGAWRLSVVLLALLAGTAGWLGRRGNTAGTPALAGLAVGLLACGLALGGEPGAFWRHGGIGAGRAPGGLETRNELVATRWTQERGIAWEAEGRESSVALEASNGYAFVINGKTDGHARLDAPTQVMSALLGALLHPAPRSGLVIGLGTGSSAGWLAAVHSIERVEVVELEPAIVEVARACAPVNHDVLANPRVEVVFGDGRELLLTTPRSYDLIFSEPSNPYRAGIASLFTRDFYQAVDQRLAPGGLFVQWLQAYEVDAAVVQSVYATLAEVFPAVETWAVHHSDLMLVASREPIIHDPRRLASRLAVDPYRAALRDAWGMEGVAGFFTGWVGGPALARRFARQHPDLVNTDDRPLIEYGFARGMGRPGLFGVADLRRVAARWGVDALPPELGLEGEELDDLREARSIFFRSAPERPAGRGERAQRSLARAHWGRGELAAAGEAWSGQGLPPATRPDRLLVAEAASDRGDGAAAALADRIAADSPIEADVVRARLAWRRGDAAKATDRLVAAFEAYRHDPWPHPELMERALELAAQVGARDRGSAERLFAVLASPFAVRMLDDARRVARVRLTTAGGLRPNCRQAFAAFEPWPLWSESLLRLRWQCYAATGDGRAADARDDLERYLTAAPPRLDGGV